MMSVLPTKGAARRPPARRRILTPYVMIWLAIAGMAAGYLAFLGMRPDVLASAKTTGPDVKQQLEGARRDMARAFADLDPMRRTMGEIKMDVANLKDAAQAAEHRDEMIMERVVALETSSQAPHGAATAQKKDASAANAAVAAAPAVKPPPPKPNPKKAAGTSPAQPKKVSTASPEAKKKSGPGIETGSIEKKKAKAAAKPVGVLIARGPSLDQLRLNWTILNDRHGDAVGKLSPRYTISGPTGNQVYGLVLGPVASKQAADSLCKTMIERGMSCEVSVYRGNAL